MIQYENEVCAFLRIPNIPKKKWDGKSAFENGVAVVELSQGDLAYAIARFNQEKDEEPQVTKVFSTECFVAVKEIYVVPYYMDTDIDNADLDDESKKHADELAKEANEIENKGIEKDIEEPENEWVFPEIHNRDEAEAWLRQYNSRHRIKGKIPKSEETIKLRLFSIYSELNKKR